MSSETRHLVEADRTLEADLAPFVDAEATLLAMQEIVGRKWHPVVVFHLLRDGPMGFAALKDRIDGVSSKMLSETLSDLQAAGLVDRELLSDQPVRVEYRLTERGAGLESLLGAMLEWGHEHAADATELRTEAA